MSRNEELERAKQELAIAQRLIAVKKSQEDLISFTRFTMPDLEDPENVLLSEYEDAEHHRVIAKDLEDLEKGIIRRLIVTIPPRHGKSELCTRKFPTWCQGRNPHWQQIITGYSETFSQQEFGKPIRNLMIGDRFKQVFPKAIVQADSKSSGFIETANRGKLTITGVGGPVTGKGADLLVIDDPYKNAEDADSDTYRNKVWDWYASTARTRLMPGGRILIVLTRWHEDDIVGRIFNPDYTDQRQKHLWRVRHMAALTDKDGNPHNDGEPLWPEWYSKEELLSIQYDLSSKKTVRFWNALYQGQPSPPDGDYFTRDMFVTYDSPKELPQNMNYYAGMDLAVSTEYGRDRSFVVTAGVDEYGDIWIVDVLWEKQEADVIVDAIVAEFVRYKPIYAWGETGQIAKSIGPFLRKRMKEKKCWTFIEESAPIGDKSARARSFRGMMAQGMVHWPNYQPWYHDLVDEFLKFPTGKHDDAVDGCAWLGLGLDGLAPGKQKKEKPKEHKVGTMGWMKWASDLNRRDNMTTEDKHGGF